MGFWVLGVRGFGVWGSRVEGFRGLGFSGFGVEGLGFHLGAYGFGFSRHVLERLHLMSSWPSMWAFAYAWGSLSISQMHYKPFL